MATREVYVCDADCLINLQGHFGRDAVRALRGLGKKGTLKLPEGVVREVVRQSDKLAKFVIEQQRHIEITVRQLPQLHVEIPKLERRYGERIVFGKQPYPGFWTSSAGRKAADAQVVAVAEVLAGIAVSNDRAVQLACSLEGVTCIGWAEFARRLGLVKPKQLELNYGEGAAGGASSASGHVGVGAGD